MTALLPAAFPVLLVLFAVAVVWRLVRTGVLRRPLVLRRSCKCCAIDPDEHWSLTPDHPVAGDGTRIWELEWHLPGGSLTQWVIATDADEAAEDGYDTLTRAWGFSGLVLLSVSPYDDER